MVNTATQDQATTKTAFGLFGGLTKRVSLVKASVPLKPYKNKQYSSDNEIFFPLGYEKLYGVFVSRMGRGASKNKISRLMSDVEMLHHEYLQPHISPLVRTSIVIDIDSELDLEALKNSDIPFPATIVGRPRSGKSVSEPHGSDRPHLRWNLSIPVNFPKFGMKNKKSLESYTRQKWVYNQIRNELIRKLKLLGLKVDTNDPCLTKNPLHDDWHMIEGDTRTWTLSELKKALNFNYEIKKPTKSDRSEYKEKPAAVKFWKDTSRQNYKTASDKYFNLEQAMLGREKMLFESMRGPAYLKKAFCVSAEQLCDFVLAEAEKFNAINNAENPISNSQVRAISKAIAYWTWDNFRTTSNRDLGACYREGLIDAKMSKSARQAVGGAYAATKKAQNAASRVRELRSKLMDDGETVSVSRLARELGMSRHTVRKYMTEKPVASENIENEARISASPAPSLDQMGGGQISSNKGAQYRERSSEPLSGTVSNSATVFSNSDVSEIGEIVLAIRDGEVWEFTRKPNIAGVLFDKDDLPVKDEYVIPYVIPREIPPDADIPF